MAVSPSDVTAGPPVGAGRARPGPAGCFMGPGPFWEAPSGRDVLEKSAACSKNDPELLPPRRVVTTEPTHGNDRDLRPHGRRRPEDPGPRPRRPLPHGGRGGLRLYRGQSRRGPRGASRVGVPRRGVSARVARGVAQRADLPLRDAASPLYELFGPRRRRRPQPPGGG